MFDSLDSAKYHLDKELLAAGYTLLTEEQYEKLKALI